MGVCKIAVSCGILVAMSSTLERLRRLHGLRPKKGEEAQAPPPPSVALQQTRAATRLAAGVQEETHRAAATLDLLIPGEVIENANGTCYLVTERYPLQVLRGDGPLAGLLAHHPATFAPFHPNFDLQESVDFQQAIFLDTETTGLGGGAGVYAFMVGIGTFEGTDFVVRQYFMRHPGEEGALLMAVAELLEQYAMSVTFNGRTFDLPLLRNRLRQNQQMYPELRGNGRLLSAGQPHLDLLHPARRLWRRRLQSCRLLHLEAEILGLQRGTADVPGHQIPQLYTDYLRNGDAAPMAGIFYHNREDIVSMVALATQLCALYGVGTQRADHEMHGLDWLALGTCHAAQKEWRHAERALRAAVERLAGNPAQAEAFAALGQLQKQQERWKEAAATWQRWLSTVPGIDPAPYEELAKYCEWQCKDLEQAAMWTQWALHNLQNAPAWQRAGGQIAALEHRLARIQRKVQLAPR